MAKTALRRGSQEEGNTEYFTGCPIGGGFMWYGLPTKIPTNCRICDNTTLAIASYAKLHENLGGAWGTDGTNLNIPDLRGRMPRGVDGVAGRDPDSASRTASNAGGNTGNAVGSVQADQYGSHAHGLKGGNGAITGLSTGAVSSTGTNATDGTWNGAGTIMQNVGGNETRPKNANVYFVIRVS